LLWRLHRAPDRQIGTVDRNRLHLGTDAQSRFQQQLAYHRSALKELVRSGRHGKRQAITELGGAQSWTAARIKAIARRLRPESTNFRFLFLDRAGALFLDRAGAPFR
jgi:hypothetical protein